MIKITKSASKYFKNFQICAKIIDFVIKCKHLEAKNSASFLKVAFHPYKSDIKSNQSKKAFRPL